MAGGEIYVLGHYVVALNVTINVYKLQHCSNVLRMNNPTNLTTMLNSYFCILENIFDYNGAKSKYHV